jgi:RNA polymerase sigma factor (TIGR02999 family)
LKNVPRPFLPDWYHCGMSEVTRILDQVQEGDPQAAQRLLPLVYDELRRLAAQKLAHERPGQTLQATALVHEAYLRLLPTGDRTEPGEPTHTWNGRRHFFLAAGEAMRRILVDRARAKLAQKRGGEGVRHDIDALELSLPEPPEDLVALDEALEKLAQADPRAAQLVHLHFFAGFTLLDAAELMGVSPRTAHRLWAYARAFLHREIQK